MHVIALSKTKNKKTRHAQIMVTDFYLNLLANTREKEMFRERQVNKGEIMSQACENNAQSRFLSKIILFFLF